MSLIEELKHLKCVQKFKEELDYLEYLIMSGMSWKKTNYEKTLKEIRKWYNRTIETILKNYIQK